jgi:polyhydroxyalkanoate synthase subunit PhaC
MPLHLMAAAMVSTSSSTAWNRLKSGWMPWSKSLLPAGNALQKDLENVNPEAFSAALFNELNRRHAGFLDGLEKYRAHAFHRTLETPPALWESGSTRLLDYGTTMSAAKASLPVLVVPSLVNRSHIMDLTADRSFLRYLASNGYRPLLVDWGTPGPADLQKSLDDYIAGDLAAALSVAAGIADGPTVPVIGYCMGGTLAAALSVLKPDQISALVLLAAPWDFHIDTDGPPPALATARPALENQIDALGHLPVDTLQTMFFALDPLQGWTKFQAFSEITPDTPSAEIFVALEDWLNDGVPLAGEVARSCLFGWYGNNEPACGKWKIAGRTIDPAQITCPTLGILPSEDRIVPPASAQALIDEIPSAELLSPKAGHIGMMVGSKAMTELWSPLSEWLRKH